MTAKRFLLVAAAFVVGIVGLLLIWPTKNRAGGLAISFVGPTNDASGTRLAQFSVANHFPRQVRVGVCEVQVWQTNGWPNTWRVAGGAAWLPVALGGERVFSIPPPSPELAPWRVPISYQEDLSLIDNVRFRIDLLAWGIPRWRPGKPAPVRHGDGFHRTLLTYGPEMGTSVEPNVTANGSQPIRSQTNQTSSAAGSRRRPHR
jgi:hypothetical protein